MKIYKTATIEKYHNETDGQLVSITRNEHAYSNQPVASWVLTLFSAT